MIDCPYLRAKLPSAAVAEAVCSRGILLRDAIELWGVGSDHAACGEAVADYPQGQKTEFFRPEVTWRIDVETYGATLSIKE